MVLSFLMPGVIMNSCFFLFKSYTVVVVVTGLFTSKALYILKLQLGMSVCTGIVISAAIYIGSFGNRNTQNVSGANEMEWSLQDADVVQETTAGLEAQESSPESRSVRPQMNGKNGSTS